MSAIVDAIKDVASNVWDAIEDAVKVVWDEVVEPILGEVMAVFGIVDETVVAVNRVSTKVYGDNAVDVVKAGITRAIFTKIETDTSFFPNYMTELYRTKAQLRASYNYAGSGLYVLGLPSLEVMGTDADLVAIKSALDTDVGGSNSILSVTSRVPIVETQFKFDMQTTNSYQPWDNTLTEDDPYGVEWSDWDMGTVVYNIGPDNWTINISRSASEAKFWIEGPNQITEGDTAVFVVKSNRTLPVGETVAINFTYAGTAVDPTDYTEVAQVVMLAETDEVEVSIVTAESASAGTNFTITLASVDNTGAFEMVTVHTIDSVACNIIDDDTLKLTVNSPFTPELDTTVTIAVNLPLVAPSGAFSVDYNFTDLGTIVGGVDYDNTPGTLNFAGTAGETQNVVVDIYADVADDDKEQFEVWFDNSSDVDGIDISAVATVTILDGSDDPVAQNATLDHTITHAAYTPEDHLEVTYQDNAEPAGQWRYWLYKFSDGTYPGLVPEASTIAEMEMLPIAILRANHISIDATPSSSTYLTTRTFMQRLGLKVQEYLDALNANPDIADVDDAFVNFAVSPSDINKNVSKILYISWHQIVVVHGITSNIDEYKLLFEEAAVNNALVWKTHTFTGDISGVKAAEGDYHHSVVGTTMTLWYQKTATEYDQIVVTNMNSMSSIAYAGHHQMALSNLSEPGFTVPVSWFVIEQLTPEEQMEVYQYMLRFDIYSIDIVEIAWYETSAFADLFSFAMIILSIFTLGATSFLTFVVDLAINYAIAELIIWVAEQTGNLALAALVGVVAAVALSNPAAFSDGTLLQADTLIEMAWDYSETVGNLETMQEQEEMIEDIKDLAEKQKAILEAEKAARTGDLMDISAMNPEFLGFLRSIESQMYPAIEGQYAYDSLYNYDSLVGNFVDTKLKTGIS